ncbi:P63C domain-containing protein [Acinetobacter baumannii]|uniref:P63C domain-containing protein n=1 Tax=Acinetobacter baumannii TaxID=470 RepID=UPI00112D0A48|nr:P63C domain-containing protein [Acinetobacter baumannii]EHU2137006.1 P63C domain-containing protein [Acinetobacter baumannii]EKU0863370.1 P63C domain-containing protein [Acinetobacter baumannii]EKU4280304.1 P63C domain-containing protein [Acinetobacter baumannii]EKX3895675.1 P63C domain-containing protein [Acinetobacter baumannii]EKX5150361.1 P63C domain-containing protein [Acinetobacter baumannii]
MNNRSNSGKATAARMTPEQLKERSKKGVEAKKAKANLPKASYTGELKLGDISVPCHVLDGEVRVISGRGLQNSLGFSKDSSGLALQSIVNSKLRQFMTQETIDKLEKPIQFVRVGSGGSQPETHGYDATILIDICDAFMQANRVENLLTDAQKTYAAQAEIIIRSVAKVGIIALVDEATGYQAVREKNALAKVLEAFVAKELQPWLKTFPDEYYKQIFRLYGLEYPPKKTHFRPGFIGSLTNEVVYERLAPELLPELKKEADKIEKKARLHQFLTSDVGHPKLREHLASLITLMKLSNSADEFKQKVNLIHPKFGDTYEMGL